MAAMCGADAVGIVLHPPAGRNVALANAMEIIAALPVFVTPVGLFVDSPVEEILDVSAQLGIRHLQLHGRETPEMVAKLPGKAVIKAIRVEQASFSQSLVLWRQAIAGGSIPNLRGIVLETGKTNQAGGSGVENDWELIRQCADRGEFEGLPPVIFAGGLNPKNVGEIVARFRPWAVDVSSGVEKIRGAKSEELVCAFIEAVARAEGNRN